MANVSMINGFRPVGHLGGGVLRCRKYYIPATDNTAVYPGDVVKLAGSSDAEGRYATVTLGAAGDGLVGVVAFFEPNLDNLNLSGQGRAASTARYVYVWDDPMIIYEAEVSNGSLAVTDVGLNANHATGSPNAASARSGAYIDAGTEAATSTLSFKILGFSSVVNNEVAASARVYVSLNKSHMAPGGQYDTGATAIIGTLGI